MPFYLISFLHFYNAHHAYLHPFFPGHFGHEAVGLRGAKASGRNLGIRALGFESCCLELGDEDFCRLPIVGLLKLLKNISR